jgi:hypothetical protein
MFRIDSDFLDIFKVELILPPELILPKVEFAAFDSRIDFHT